MEVTKQISPEQGQRLFTALGLESTKLDPEQFTMGLNVELEHVNILEGNLKKLALLVLAHLKEQPDYYTRLQAVEDPNQPDQSVEF